MEPVTSSTKNSCDALPSQGETITVGHDAEHGISPYWRRNTSQTESVELANVLRALRKITGHISLFDCRIEWAGMTMGKGDSIVLDPAPVMGEYPVSPKKFDALAGIVIHEWTHRTEWSERVWQQSDKAYQAAFPDGTLLQKSVFQKIVHTGEDIFVDYVSGCSILGKYTEAPRNHEIQEKMKNLPVKIPISVDKLFLVWWAQAFGEKAPYDLPECFEEPLSILGELAEKLRHLSRTETRVIERCDLRSKYYIETWGRIKELISSWKVISKMLIWAPQKKNGATKAETPAPTDRPAKLNKGLALDIETNLSADSVNITPFIRHVVGHDNEDVTPISRCDFNIPSHPVIDYKLVARLRAIFQDYAERRIMKSRGLTSGRIDSRKLFRAHVTGRCFYEKQKIPVLDWNVCLLIDASGSMVGNKWKMVENSMGTLHRAFRGFQNRLQAYAYFEADRICMISKLIDGRRLLSVPPMGLTASGQAIIAAAYFMRRDNRRRFLIHITDGESNLGCDVQHGIDYCKKENINLVTLGVSYKERKAMQKQYGKSIQFLDHFGQLPSALESLLKWTFVYGKQVGRQVSGIGYQLPGIRDLVTRNPKPET